MKSPAELLLRRTALGVSRELVARIAGREVSSVERNERPKSYRIPLDQFQALDRLEAWLDRETLHLAIAEDAEAHRIDGWPVVWVYSADAMAHCPHHLAKLADREPELFRIAAADAFTLLHERHEKVIAAEFLPGPYQEFCDRHQLHDTPDNRCRWWRHWMQQYVVYDRNAP